MRSKSATPLPYFGKRPAGSSPIADRDAQREAMSAEVEGRLIRLPVLVLIVGMILVVSAPVATAKPPVFTALVVAAGVTILLYVTHLLVRWLVPRADHMLLPLALTLTVLGLLFLWRLEPSLMLADPDHADEYKGMALKQTLVLAASLAVMLLVMARLRNVSALRRYKYIAALVGLALVAATMIFGTDTGSGVRLWYRIGFFTFQPSELLKVLLVIFVAGYLDDKRYLLSDSQSTGHRSMRLPPLPYLSPMLALWSVALLIFFVERDQGSALLFFCVFLIILYVASGNPRYVLGGIALFITTVTLVSLLFPRAMSTAAVRYTTWLDPWSQAADRGHQMIQSVFAMTSGGVMGTGIAYGQPYWVPAVHTDLISAAISEELGLAGMIVVLCLIAMLVYRGLRIALSARWGFEQLLALGLTVVLGLQSLIILGGATKLIPLTGVTLPFVSYGGSSLLINWVIIGILLRISNASTKSDDAEADAN
ncbi:MAG TPA: FtsW/RodA/SpoVE family cell cycle protein [Chloroflexia bacterium]|nr:FtsW/RodA/SpoVE family cell cycle protein [Chloroflexia bacterium]